MGIPPPSRMAQLANLANADVIYQDREDMFSRIDRYSDGPIGRGLEAFEPFSAARLAIQGKSFSGIPSSAKGGRPRAAASASIERRTRSACSSGVAPVEPPGRRASSGT